MTETLMPTATVRFFRERLINGHFELMHVPDDLQSLIGLAARCHANPESLASDESFVRLPEMDAWLIFFRPPDRSIQLMLCPPHLQIVDYGFDTSCDFLCLALSPATLVRWGLPPPSRDCLTPASFPLLEGAVRRAERRGASWEETTVALLREIAHLPQVPEAAADLCENILHQMHVLGPTCRVAELAEIFDISQRQLNRIMISTTGYPMKDWRRGERMVRTLVEWWHGQDLRDPLALGWSDSSHLYRECRLLFGCGQRRIRQALHQHRIWAQAWHLPAASLGSGPG